jgi:predicted acylesterase/phospholipase RssA
MKESIMRNDVQHENHRPPRLKHRPGGRPPFECIALLLQGGGALGAYQASAYEALADAGLHPDWTAGISIGAINAAIIAGNPPDERVAKCRWLRRHASNRRGAQAGVVALAVGRRREGRSPDQSRPTASAITPACAPRNVVKSACGLSGASGACQT